MRAASVILALLGNAWACSDLLCPLSQVGNRQRGDGSCDSGCNSTLCDFDNGDCITAANPLQVYVSATSAGPSLGSSAQPYTSFSQALSEIWAPFSVIYLLSGSHIWQFSTPPLNRTPLKAAQISLEIRTLFCAMDGHDECAETAAVVQLTRDAVELRDFWELRIRDVVVVGNFTLKDNCSDCVYCPSMTSSSSPHLFTNDRNQSIPLTSFAESPLCQAYHSQVLIRAGHGTTIEITNVLFTNIRHQPLAIIYSRCGLITLRNVTFEDVMTAKMTKPGAVIIEEGDGVCGGFSYTAGVVSLLNNGYELSTDWTFGSFLKATKVPYLTLSSVLFQGSLMSITLIDCQGCSFVRISDCFFHSNLVKTAIITLSPLPGTISLAVLEASLLHYNIAEDTLLSISAEYTHITVSNMTFDHNLVFDENAVRIAPHTALGNDCVSLIDSCKFAYNVIPALISVTDLKEFQVRDSSFVNNGDGLGGESMDIMTDFVELQGTYVEIVRFPYLRSDCMAIVSVAGTGNVSLSNSLFKGNNCTSGSTGIVITENNPGIVSLRNVSFIENIGPPCLQVSGPATAYMTEMRFRGNSNWRTVKPACIYLTLGDFGDYTITNSEFISNSAIANTVILSSGVIRLKLSGVILRENVAITVSAGVVFEPFNGNDSYFSLMDSLFESNSANATGVILLMTLNNKPQLVNVPMHLTISRSVFRDNKSTFEGCSVSVLTYMQLSEDSRIEECQFVDNSCEDRGAGVYAEFRTGHLSITSSLFQGLSGSEGVAIFHNNHGTQGNTAQITVISCVFQQNYGSSIVLIEGIITPMLATQHCLFLDNKGSGVVTIQGIWTDYQSRFSNNSARWGGALKSYNSQLDLKDAYFFNNSAEQKGGAVVLTSGSRFICNNCKFERNRCPFLGGALYADEESVITGSNFTFLRNYVGEKGSACYIHRSSMTLISSLLTMNDAGAYGTIFLSSATVLMTDSEMSYNTATIRSPGISASLGVILIQRSYFHDQRGVSGGCIFGGDQSSAVVESSIVRNCTANSGGAFVFIALSDLTLRNSTVSDCSAITDGGMLTGRIATIRIETTTVTNVLSAQEFGSIALLESTLILASTVFSNLTNSAIFSFSSTVNITLCSFSSITAFYGGALYCSDCVATNVKDTNVTDCIAKRGGAMVADRSGLIPPNIHSTFSGNRFENNTAMDGGCFYLANMYTEFVNNTFIGNSAKKQLSTDSKIHGVGGAIYFDCPSTLPCEFTLTNNTFRGNSATIAGGAVRWWGMYPSLIGNDMSDNSAPYGQDIASYPIRLALLLETGVIAPYESGGNRPLLIHLKEMVSGQMYVKELKVGLVDHYGHIVTTDSVSTADIRARNETGISLSGHTHDRSNHGVFKFIDFMLLAPPGTTQTLEITTSGVDPTIKAFNSDPTTYYPIVTFDTDLRQCVPGEAEINDMCYPCTENTYSLSPKDPCLSCPSQAKCYGMDKMVPLAGYWRPDPTRNLFFECINKDACLGSPDPKNLSLTGLCAPGYHGNLCSTCDQDHSSQSSGVCSLCPSLASNLALTLILGLIVAVSFVLLVAITIRGANQPRSELAIYVKLFLNYLQMVMVAGSMHLKWPAYVSLFLSSQQAMGSASEQLLSIECLLKDMSTTEVYYTNIGVYVTAPGLIIASALVFWLGIAVCSKAKHCKEKFIGSVVLLLFLLHTSLTKITFAIFNCMELLPKEYWLVGDLSVRCWDQKHLNNVMRLAFPGLLVWVVGLPTLSLILLMRMKRFLMDSNTRYQFSFLYKGYRPEWYFWEFVILYRKIAVVSISVFLSTVSTSVQGLSMMAVVLVCFFLQLLVKPFHTEVFNSLELKGLLASFITIYSGLYFETKSISNDYTGSIVNVVIFMLIVVANAYFFLSWVRHVLPLLLGTLIRRLVILKSRFADVSVANPLPDNSLSLHFDRSMDGSRPSNCPAAFSELPSPAEPPQNTSQNLEKLPRAVSLAE